MSTDERTGGIDFSVNMKNLYREEAFTDMTGASIRRFTPIKRDGSRDKKRPLIFLGNTQLVFTQGSIPVQCVIEAKNIDQAFKRFPPAMKEAAEKALSEIEEMEKKKEDSRIILPGQ